jgi:hypothetical protein
MVTEVRDLELTYIQTPEASFDVHASEGIWLGVGRKQARYLGGR